VTELVIAVVAGVTLGGTFALVGLGLVLAFRATGTFNFAHGELMLLPAFIVGYLTGNGTPVGWALAIALVVSAVVGGLFYGLVLRRTTGQPPIMGIIATFGLAFVLDGIMGIYFPGTQYAVNLPGIPTGSVEIFGAHASTESLTFAAITFGLAVIVVGVLRYTNVGIRVRAAGQDAMLASQSGISVRWVHTISWVVAALLAAVAGISYASVTTANTALISLGLAAIPAIILGGMDSIEGAVVGGVLLGIVQAFAQTYLGGQYVDVITYGILLVVLLLRPQGLFGTKSVVRA
jgi:branched-chain amino acid transport system permease protein